MHRFDDAFFDAKGTAYTRVQVRAPAFESLKPVETLCGNFDVTVTLDGEQPITKMQILRDSTEGGRFFSPISVIVKLNFVAADGSKHEPLVISRRLDFKAMDNGRWTESPAKHNLVAKSFLLVDTNADGDPDTYLPGTSNFIASAGEPVAPGQKAQSIIQQPSDCHCEYATCGHQHCITVPTDDCGGYVCR